MSRVTRSAAAAMRNGCRSSRLTSTVVRRRRRRRRRRSTTRLLIAPDPISFSVTRQRGHRRVWQDRSGTWRRRREITAAGRGNAAVSSRDI